MRKCYFANYCFSEDLDFTLRHAWPIEALAVALEQARAWSLETDGPDFGAAPVRLEVVNDEYGLESYQARVYYRRPLRWAGPPRSIQLDVSRGEPILFPRHNAAFAPSLFYADQLTPVAIPCYDLAEMLAEKLRARFRPPTVCHLARHLRYPSVGWPGCFPGGLAAKGLPPNSVSAAGLTQRWAIFEADWERRLAHLLPPQQPVTFAAAWQSAVNLVTALQAPDTAPHR